ncbi:MAG TPA: DUF4430 domain-containing protein [Gaiellaceae bacterium]|nr:DUF4430 domain-containing protein [Gaiellaceae bacterium]
MAKRVVLLVVLALALPATALAATVKVRVEGKTRTIFAPAPVTVTATSALDALEQASILGEFYYHVTVTGFGPYVDQIGRYPGSGSSGWVFKVDNASPPVGADKVVLKDGDDVLWYYATFGPNGGPPTLQLNAATGGCYVAQAFDDNGKPASVTNLVLHIGSKRTMTAQANTKVCPGAHKGLLVRATADGAVRSNALK